MNEKLSNIINHPLRVPIGVGVVSFGIGLGVGYILGRRQTDEVYEIEEEIELDFDLSDLADEDDETIVEMEPLTSFDQLGDHLVIDMPDIQEGPQGPSGASVAEKFIASKLQETADDEAPVEQRNVFAEDDDDWDYEAEKATRSEAEPYILHKDEFFAVENDYSQLTLTYYAGDNILADEDDKPIYNHSTITGPLRFGHGSADPNVVYIRNDKHRAEYEVLYDEGLFAVEVAGLEMEQTERKRDLQHSKISKFRDSD